MFYETCLEHEDLSPKRSRAMPEFQLRINNLILWFITDIPSFVAVSDFSRPRVEDCGFRPSHQILFRILNQTDGPTIKFSWGTRTIRSGVWDDCPLALSLVKSLMMSADLSANAPQEARGPSFC
jgi:hypothetical protein